MEGLILLGILGAGYLINEDKEKKQKVYTEIQPPLFTGSGNTIYDMNNVKDAQRYEIDQVMKHHNQAMDPGSKVIDALNMDGRDTLRGQEVSSNEIQTLDGNTKNKSDFLVNDQGIKLEPFYGGEGPAPVDLTSQSRELERTNGGFMTQRPSKRSDLVPNFGDQWVKNITNVF